MRQKKKKQQLNIKKPLILVLGISAILAVTFFIINIYFANKIWYQDFDNDGFGNEKVFIYQRFKPDGYISNKEDSDDKDACLPINGKQCKTDKQTKKNDPKRIIKKLVVAENNRDTNSFKQIYRESNLTYFSKKDITINELISYYESIWRKLKKGENNLISISKIRKDRYEYITQFTWESRSGKTGMSTDTILVRFDADKISALTYRK